MPRSTESRFWDKVQKTQSCWIWLGSKNPKGYGYFGDPKAKRVVLAHRYSWELHYGPIPSDEHVLHRCDNPPCVRPDHLFLGSELDNHLDAVTKGRKRNEPIEAIAAIRKFSAAEVREIRELYESQRHAPKNVARPYSLRGLAKMFNVTYAEIAHIVKLKVYKNDC